MFALPFQYEQSSNQSNEKYKNNIDDTHSNKKWNK